MINLTTLKYFCDSVKLGSTTAAAKANFVTQSAISQGIIKLELSLGISLIAHHPNRFRLTPEGEKVFEQGLDILKRAEQFQQSLSKNHLGDLEFACTYSFGLAIIPHHLKTFTKKYPEVKIHFDLGKNESIKQLVKNGSIDFGILPDEGDLDGFHVQPLHSGNLKLYVSKKIPPSKWHTLGFILGAPTSKEVLYLKQVYYEKFHKELPAILDVNSWEVIASLASEGLGIGYFPDYIIHRKENLLQECDLGLKLQQYQFSAISPLGMKLRKSSELFLELIKT